MITSISVDGYKTLSQFKLLLNPGLNILVGPNGSGKTNIVSFFEFLSHLVEQGPSEATSHLGGAGAVFRRTKDTYQAQITANVTGCYALDEGRFRLPGHEHKGKEMKYAAYEYSFTLLFSNEFESVVFSQQHFRYRHAEVFINKPALDPTTRDWDLDIEAKLENDLNTSIKIRNAKGSFINYLPFFRHDKPDKAVKETEDLFARIISPTISIPSLLIRFTPVMMLLSDDITRGQTYNVIPSRVKVLEDSAKPPGVGSDGSGLAATLYSLRKRNVDPQKTLWGLYTPQNRSSLKSPSLQTLIGYFQLANNTIKDIEVVNDPFTNQLRVTVSIENGDYTAKIPLALMSDGTLKWITLLTAALTAASVLSIEEPENYLHPSMQGQFVKIMREILFTEREHGCTLMTTHSETLLNHCKPSELIIVSLKDGKTVAMRCTNEVDISDEIEKTGFGLGYYYIAGALPNE
jgi:predicted ATPase